MSKPQQSQKNRKEQIARSYDAGVSNRAPKPKKDKGKDAATKTAAAPAPAGPSASATTTIASKSSVSNLASGAKQKYAQTPGERTAVSQAERHGAVGSSKKPSAADPNQRVVFKSTLDTPFRVDWPTVDRKLAVSLRDSIVDAATNAGVSAYQASRGRRNGRYKKQDSGRDAKDESKDQKPSHSQRKRKASNKDAEEEVADDPRPSKKLKRDINDINDETTKASRPEPLPQPGLLSGVLLGINNVTRHLEDQIQHLSAAKRASTSSTTVPTAASLSIPLKYVLVCTGDIDPPLLVSHIPHLVAGCNSNSSEEADLLVLVPLPKGSELLLAQAFGLPRVSVLGIMASAPSGLLESMRSLSNSFPVLRAPWLVVPTAPPPLSTKPSASPPSAMLVDVKVSTSSKVPAAGLIPTHVKQLRTTAPHNMIAAKRERQELRKAAKVRLVLHRDKESSEKLRRKMAGGKAAKKHRVIVTSLDAVPADAS